MQYVIQKQPLVEPVSLAEAKQHLRVDGTDDDALITAMIVAARKHAENYTDRAFITQSWYLYLDAQDLFSCHPGQMALGGNRPIRIASKHPIITVREFSYQNPVGVWHHFGASWDDPNHGWDESEIGWDERDYFFDTPTAKVYPLQGKYWPLAAWPYFSGWRIGFDGGYGNKPEDVPEPIRLAIKTLVLHFYENRSAYTATGPVLQVPAAFEHLLMSYKLFDHGHF